jgi:hypothetical protein
MTGEYRGREIKGEKKSSRGTISASTIDYYMEMVVKWADCTGNTAATWPLEAFLGMRGEIAFFETRDAAESRKALIEILPSGSEGSAETRRSWTLANQLLHPGLLRLRETGETEVDGVPVNYAVLTLPDDDVGEILATRKLSEEETRAMLARAAAALTYLHGCGLRHGSVTPPNVFVVGSDVRLGVDTIAPAGDSGRGEDIRQLGGTLIEALTGKRDPAAAGELPAPLAEIARGCLESPGGEWTAARVALALKKPPVEPQPDPEPLRIMEPEAGGQRWIYAAAAGLAVLVGFGYWLIRPPAHEQAAKPAPPPVAAAAPAPVNKPSPIEPQTQAVKPAPVPAQPRETKPVQHETQFAKRETQPAEQPRPRTEQEADRRSAAVEPVNSWAVIGAAYGSYGAAQHRASNVQKLLEKAKVHVFPNDGKGSMYYVVLGSGMTKAEAERLRDRAIRSGAPRDSYVTKIRE